MNLLFGQVVNVRLPERVPKGHEQTGLRPCLLINDPSNYQELKFPMLLVAPITKTLLKPGLMRVRLDANTAGLKESGIILIDQLLMLDASRLRGYYGQLPNKERNLVKKGLEALLGDL
jgi:mRNA-degrading endonuclease toxin of MazEF toxin-antitoxin module